MVDNVLEMLSTRNVCSPPVFNACARQSYQQLSSSPAHITLMDEAGPQS